ncbi:MAG: 30S ribosomal protein S3 [Thermoplasmata archaeon]|nr:MAG: 30S ribosomal protein S3 [Thermoplasmata archaeon]
MTSERKFVMENIRRYLLKEYLMRETKRAGFGGLDIQRTPMGTRVTLTIERPGLVIGRRGGSIKFLERSVEEDFNFDNPKIEVQEVGNPSLNAQIMAEKLASALERGWHFRRAGHSTVRRIMDAGAKGCQVVISGKLTGQRHRVEKFKEGHIKFCGEPATQWMEEGFAVAKRKLGVIGVKVQIMDPDSKLPDDVEIFVEKEEEEKPEEKEEKPTEEPKKELKKVEKKPKIDKKKLEKKLKKEKLKHKLPEEELEKLEELEEEISIEPEGEVSVEDKEEGGKEAKEEVKSDEPDKKQGN